MYSFFSNWPSSQALLGIPIAAPGQSSFAALSSTTAAGIRRENACQSIHKQALDSIYDLGVLFESNIENLESILVVTQMLICKLHFSSYFFSKYLTN